MNLFQEPDIQKLEEKIGMGQIEEVIQQVFFMHIFIYEMEKISIARTLF